MSSSEHSRVSRQSNASEMVTTLLDEDLDPLEPRTWNNLEDQFGSSFEWQRNRLDRDDDRSDEEPRDTDCAPSVTLEMPDQTEQQADQWILGVMAVAAIGLPSLVSNSIEDGILVFVLVLVPIFIFADVERIQNYIART